MQALQQQYDAKQKANADIANTISQGANDISNMIMENQRKHEAEAEQRRLQNEMDQLERDNENAEREQRAAAKRKSDEEARIAAYNAEQRRIAKENENINMWQNKSNKIIPANLTEKTTVKKTSQITDESLKKVYYVIWNFGSTSNQIVIANPVEIKKDGDGDWPMNADLLKKIQTQTNLIISQTPDRINTTENRLGYLLGYFTDVNQALNAIKDIKANAIRNGYSVTTINNTNPEEKKTNDQKQKAVDDFWKE